MQRKSEYPINKWLSDHLHQEESEIKRRVRLLDAARHALGVAHTLENQWEEYLTRRRALMPNLVECVSKYGYARCVVKDWDEFPIEIPPEDVAAWREWGFGANLREFRTDWLGGIAGGFLELSGKNPDVTARLINDQLRPKYARLAELTNKPVEWYTPETFTEDEIAEMEDDWDNERIEEVFSLFEELNCFSYAFPYLRTFCMTETDADLGLPNMKLFGAFEVVDLIELYQRLSVAEDKLRPILKFLARKGHIDIVNRWASPDSFWWRHWSESRPNRRG